MGRIQRTELWHVGTVVADIRLAIADYQSLGSDGISPIATLSGKTFVGEQQLIVDESYEVAWLKLSAERSVIELIAPKTDGPQKRLLEQRPGPSHLAYWCHSLIDTAQYFTDRGANLVLAPLTQTSLSERDLQGASLTEILTESQTCYLRLPSDLIIELNPVHSRKTMTQVWGDDILSLVPEPAIA